jgi:2-amino-4-hydroxy-6-hydroxymethyldihydropteridine diphosphokinase
VKRPHRVFIGLGSNLHQPARQLRRALDELSGVTRTRLVAASGFYRSAPLGCPEPQPDYVNAVAELETALPPEALLHELRAIETRHGRRPGYRNAPRVLDLDVLLFDQKQVSNAILTLPHPRMCERAFVLAPLVELHPELVLPDGRKAADCLAALGAQRIDRLTPQAAEAPEYKVA